ncbi:hypothetical protein ACFQ60_44585 [Streptomyces zhihengii]
MDIQHFERISAFVEARLRPLFDAETGSDHGFGMDDTSRALRALLNTVRAAAAVRGSRPAATTRTRPPVPSSTRRWSTTGTCCAVWPATGRTTRTSSRSSSATPGSSKRTPRRRRPEAAAPVGPAHRGPHGAGRRASARTCGRPGPPLRPHCGEMPLM